LHPSSHRNTIANTIINSLMANESVEAIFLSGSTATGGTDEFSDIDINIVVQQPQAVKDDILRLIQKYYKIAYAFTPPHLNNILVIYLNDLTKIDIGVYSTEEITSKKLHIQNKDIVIKGSVPEIQTTKNTVSQEGFTYLAMALADLIAVPREIFRRNIYEARANLDDARKHIAIYINLINNDRYHNFNNFNRYLTQKQLHVFQESLKNNDEYSGILESALSLLSIIKGMKEYRIGLIKTVEEYLKKQSRRVPHPQMNL